jgi:hypothetical protein
MATPIPMPTRNERTAPKFDTSRPRELPRFFEDLEDLMTRAQITTDVDKKKQAVRYTDFETEQIWKAVPEFKDNTKTYNDFKKAIMQHYPDAAGDFIYSIRDMDLLIGERQRIGMATAKDLSDYHLQFMAITTWLIEKTRLSDLEQQRAYVRAFPTDLLQAINNRLQLKQPDHHPSVPYKVTDVYAAAQFILQGTSSIGFYSSAPTIAPPSTTTDRPLKIEDIRPIMAELMSTVVEAMKTTSSPQAQQVLREMLCIMCGGKHSINDCAIVEDYIKAGKCYRNQMGRVVLPTGAQVPRAIQGKNLAERFDEWHRQHPNQLVANTTPTLIHTIDRQLVHIPLARQASQPQIQPPNYALSHDERIAAMQAEIYNICKAKEAAAAAVRTRAQKAKAPAEIDEERAVAEARKAIPRIET